MRSLISLFLLIYCSVAQSFGQTGVSDALVETSGSIIYGSFIRFMDEQVLFVRLNGDTISPAFSGVQKIRRNVRVPNQEPNTSISSREHLRSKFESSFSLALMSSSSPINGGVYFAGAGAAYSLGMGYRFNPYIFIGLQASFERMNRIGLPLLAEMKLNINKRRFSPYIAAGAGRYQETNSLSALISGGMPINGFSGLTTRNGLGFDFQATTHMALSFSLCHRYYNVTSSFDSWNNTVVTNARLHRIALEMGLRF